MMKTDVFLVSSFNHVAHGWEKTMKPRKVRRLLQEVRKMIQHLPIALDYKRVYIPKDPRNPKGALRPLGVPTVAWRIYLHMWNVLVN
jgi:retron-type reverse transcriptase